MSYIKVKQLGIGFIPTKSTPIFTDCRGIYFSATCSQPPGAAHKSTREFAFSKNLYFLFIWISLKAALDL